MATLVNDGLEKKAKLLNGTDTAPFKWMAIGIGTGAEAITDTALGSEIVTGGGERAEAVFTYEADYIAKWEYTFNFTAAFAVSEVGIFDQLALPGKMLMRHLWTTPKPIGDGDSLQLTLRETESRV